MFKLILLRDYDVLNRLITEKAFRKAKELVSRGEYISGDYEKVMVITNKSEHVQTDLLYMPRAQENDEYVVFGRNLSWMRFHSSDAATILRLMQIFCIPEHMIDRSEERIYKELPSSEEQKKCARF